ncbi:hypothetical protein AAG570_008901 [Ranatra chinensis]|uniref:Uncharacterized protein n=1 Tax=Ranatra chinensis TaxID=642074 RepID=A0ABD0ZFJ0_9HEMI
MRNHPPIASNSSGSNSLQNSGLPPRRRKLLSRLPHQKQSSARQPYCRIWRRMKRIWISKRKWRMKKRIKIRTKKPKGRRMKKSWKKRKILTRRWTKEPTTTRTILIMEKTI